jgi:hypothetical protein
MWRNGDPSVARFRASAAASPTGAALRGCNLNLMSRVCTLHEDGASRSAEARSNLERGS